MDYQFYLDGEKIELKAERNGELLKVLQGESNFNVEVSELADGRFLLRTGDQNHIVRALKVEHKIFVLTDNESFTFELPTSKDSDAFGADQGEHGDKSKIHAPMPGKVVKVLVQPGDKVEPKQKLVIVEAMKMENPLVSPFKAEVVKVNCVEGDLVDSDKILIELNQLA